MHGFREPHLHGCTDVREEDQNTMNAMTTGSKRVDDSQLRQPYHFTERWVLETMPFLPSNNYGNGLSDVQRLPKNGRSVTLIGFEGLDEFERIIAQLDDEAHKFIQFKIFSK